MKKTIRVRLKDQPYPILIGENTLGELPHLIKKLRIGTDAVLITNATILAKHGKKLQTLLRRSCRTSLTLTVPDTEKSKNAGTALTLIKRISSFDRHKRIFLVAFGGGVIGDLAGFIAAIYKRGVPYIQIPTTFLAQIDSSIGGKTAIDTSFGKNLIGAFWQPRLVVADTGLLKTLPRSQFRAGLAEAVKYGLIKSPRLLSFLKKNHTRILRAERETLEEVVYRCALIKARVIERDVFDRKGTRAILNFGHTLAHAVEAASNFKVGHGEAVSMGMVCAARLSARLNLLNHNTATNIEDTLSRMGLPTTIRRAKQKDILRALPHDKKFRGVNRFVLLERIGRTKIVEDISWRLIHQTIAEMTGSRVSGS